MWIPPPPPRKKLDTDEEKAKRFFANRGIMPTLSEFREVCACMINGSKPLGIH